MIVAGESRQLREYVAQNYCLCGHHASVHVSLRGRHGESTATRCKAKGADGRLCDCAGLRIAALVSPPLTVR